MFVDLVQRNQDNMDGECANARCSFKSRHRPVYARASYYDTHRHSWVCASCATGINRMYLQVSRKFIEMHGGSLTKPRCISGEEATVLKLQGQLS